MCRKSRQVTEKENMRNCYHDDQEKQMKIYTRCIINQKNLVLFFENMVSVSIATSMMN